MSVAPERTYNRDLEFSLRHRHYGNDCKAVDLDHLPFRFNEYYRGEPVGLIEYKHERACFIDYLRFKNFHALIRLGDRAGLPVFCAYYASDFSKYIVDPLNSHASKFFLDRTELTEHKYVKFLHELRGLKVHDNYIDWLLSEREI